MMEILLKLPMISNKVQVWVKFDEPKDDRNMKDVVIKSLQYETKTKKERVSIL